MRPHLLLAAGMLLPCLPIRADEQAEARKILDRYVQALGGEAQVKKLETIQVKLRASAKINGFEFMATMEGTQRNADQMRMDVMAEINAMAQQLLFVMNKDKAWFKIGNNLNELPKVALSSTKQFFNAVRLPQFVVLAKPDDYKLSLLGELQEGARTLQGIKAGHQEYKDANVWFDKATGLPFKMDLTVPGLNDQEIKLELRYEEFKETNGVNFPVKATLSFDEGKQVINLEVLSWEPVDNVDENLFAKPG